MSSAPLNLDTTGYAESLEGLRWMRDHWNVSVIRAVMAVDTEGGYLDDPAKAEGQVRTIIENAIAAGVYVIVDWHDQAAEEHEDEAKAFFAEISADYGDVPNVLYEIYGEPLDVDWVNDLRPYYESVINVIRAHDADNLIILGMPNRNREFYVAWSPVFPKLSYDCRVENLASALNFNACTERAQLRSLASDFMWHQRKLFVTQWDAIPADGDAEEPTVCDTDAQVWVDFLEKWSASWTAWKLDACADSCFFKDHTAPVNGGWTDEHLNEHARYVVSWLRGEDPVSACEPTGTCAAGDGMDCNADDELIERDCSACAVLSCAVLSCGVVLRQRQLFRLGYRWGAARRPGHARNYRKCRRRRRDYRKPKPGDRRRVQLGWRSQDQSV